MIGFRYVPTGHKFTFFVSKAGCSDADVFIAADSGGLVQQLSSFSFAAADAEIALRINRCRVEVFEFTFDSQVDLAAGENDAAVIGKVIGIKAGTTAADHNALDLFDIIDCRNF